MRCEWDERKNRANERKHGVSFQEAACVFEDPLALSKLDRRRDDERWITLGSAGDRILFVAHTYHDSEGEEQEEVIRIISARQATAAERRAYYGETEPRHQAGHKPSPRCTTGPERHARNARLGRRRPR